MRGDFYMKIRLTGSEKETIAFAEMLDKVYDVVSISEFYPNTRKNIKSKEGRVYMEIKLDLVDKHRK
jgi:hypothetical protein